MLNRTNTDALTGFDQVWQDICSYKMMRTERPAQDHHQIVLGAGVSCLVHAGVLAIALLSFNPQQDEGIGYETAAIDIVIADDETVVTPLIEPQQKADSINNDQSVQTEPEQQKPLSMLDDELILKSHHQEEKPELQDHPAHEDKVEATPPAVTKTQSVAVISHSYSAEIAKHLAKHKRFPAIQKNSPIEGTVQIAFEIDERGQVIVVTVVGSSGTLIFDEEAKAMIERAAPFPVDQSQSGKRLSFSIPVTYKQNPP